MPMPVGNLVESWHGTISSALKPDSVRLQNVANFYSTWRSSAGVATTRSSSLSTLVGNPSKPKPYPARQMRVPAARAVRQSISESPTSTASLGETPASAQRWRETGRIGLARIGTIATQHAPGGEMRGQAQTFEDLPRRAERLVRQHRQRGARRERRRAPPGCPGTGGCTARAGCCRPRETGSARRLAEDIRPRRTCAPRAWRRHRPRTARSQLPAAAGRRTPSRIAFADSARSRRESTSVPSRSKTMRREPECSVRHARHSRSAPYSAYDVGVSQTFTRTTGRPCSRA